MRQRHDAGPRVFRTTLLVLLTLAAVGAGAQTAATPAAPVPQVPLLGSKIPQFVDPLPKLQTIVAGRSAIEIKMLEFQTQVLSTGTFVAGVAPKTWVWGYTMGRPSSQTYLGPIIVAKRGIPTTVKWINQLGATATSNLLAWKNSVDQTLHWADPLNNGANMGMMNVIPGQAPLPPWNVPYSGVIPATVHLHGGEIPPAVDGGPQTWYTSDGKHHGNAFYSRDLKPQDKNNMNYSIYTYPNTQEAAPLWFHDHDLGTTRLNVYAGLAGGYLLTDPVNDPKNLPAVTPLIIQDRMFDTNGQLFFPAGPGFALNPEHPLWVPEFVGDTICVNGRTWPYFNVQAKRAAFLFLNGSNARSYELWLENEVGGTPGPAMYVVADDGGYLDAPQKLDPAAAVNNHLFIMPGERYVVIVDFAGVAPGTRFLLKNSAPAPFPTGLPVDPATTAKIMEFRVVTAIGGADMTYNPATGAAIRAQPTVRLADPAAGTVAAGVTVNKIRQLTLNEIAEPPSVVGGVAYPGGPTEIMVNNTDYMGMQSTPQVGAPAILSVRADFTPFTVGGVTAYASEVPQEGTTEVWEIVNLTADTHPIHLHLSQFQLVNRQAYDTLAYPAAYAAAFPGGAFIPGWGPPLNYATGNARALGGNPDITPYLVGAPLPPSAQEVGWKDTVAVPPGFVTRFIVRWAPLSLPVNAAASALVYPFDPQGLGRGYVWHCHIIDHEDNEMMRQYILAPTAGAVRTFVPGKNY